jgi:hypothetical protein
MKLRRAPLSNHLQRTVTSSCSPQCANVRHQSVPLPDNHGSCHIQVRTGLTTDGVRTLWYSAWLHFTFHFYTHTIVSSVTFSQPLLGSGFQWRMFPSLWAPELSSYPVPSFSQHLSRRNPLTGWLLTNQPTHSHTNYWLFNCSGTDSIIPLPLFNCWLAVAWHIRLLWTAQKRYSSDAVYGVVT